MKETIVDKKFYLTLFNCELKFTSFHFQAKSSETKKEKRSEEEKPKSETKSETSTVNQTAVALQIEEYKKTIHNYKAYNATLYPLK